MVKIGNFLFEQRAKKGLTQEQLASLVGVSFKTISKWECGGSFPDVLYQLPLCDALGITLKELQIGEFDKKERITKKTLVIFSRVSIITFIVMIPIFCALLIYFISHFNTVKIYQIFNDDSSVNVGKISGILVNSYKNNYISISSIDLDDYVFDSNDIISMDLYSSDTPIYHSNVIEPFTLNYTPRNIIDRNQLKLMINIQKLDGEEKNYIFNLLSMDKVQSHSLVDNDRAYTLKEQDLETILKNQQYQSNDKKIWTKTTQLNDEKISITYNINKQTITYSKNTKDFCEIFKFYNDFNMLEITIHSIDNIRVIVEKYYYYYDDDKLDCQIGICASYKRVLKTMEPYVTLLRGE